MRAFLTLILAVLAAPALDAPVPVFHAPRDRLVAVYDQIKASEDWETYDTEAAFDELGTFSTRLHDLFEAADAEVIASGSEIGVLDFSPFINGQDSGGLDFVVGTAKVKGDRAAVGVEILLDGRPLSNLAFDLVDEGAAGWKVDDIILPMGEAEGTWRLSDYFADPLRQ